MKLKRTKTGEGGPNALPPSTATHYAKKVDAGGCVIEWTADEAQACEIDALTAERVKAHYAGRKYVGTMTFPGEEPATVGVGHPAEDDLKDAVAQIKRQTDLIARQRDQIDSLEGLRRDLDAEREEHRKFRIGLLERKVDHEGTRKLHALAEENAALKLEVAALKEKLAAATEEMDAATAPDHPAAGHAQAPAKRGPGRPRKAAHEEPPAAPVAEGEPPTGSN